MPIPEDQGWLIERMQKLGYRSNQEGICYGVAHMGMQAILSRGVDTFNARLENIASIPTEQMEKEIQQAYALRQKNQKAKLPHVPVPAEEIRPFFDGVELYYQPHQYQDWFEPGKAPKSQQGEFATSLLQSDELQKKGRVNKEAAFAGAYTEKDLESYAQAILSAFSKIPSENQEPVALVLISDSHAITVGYDPEKKEWLFIDANQLPAKHIPASNAKNLATNIYNAFFSKKICMMTTEVYGLKSDQGHLNKVIEELRQEEVWKDLHTITPTKATLVNHGGISLLHLVAFSGQEEQLKPLLEAGANIHLADNRGDTPVDNAIERGTLKTVETFLDLINDVNQKNLHGYSMLHVAALFGRIDIVNAIIKKGAEVDKISDDGLSPLYCAAEKGHLDVVKTLIKAGADVNLENGDGVTPLMMAANEGHKEVVEVLINEHAEINKAMPGGWTPLLLAIQGGHVDVAKALIAKGADVNLGLDDGTTPLGLATEMGHDEFIQLLQKKNNLTTPEENENVKQTISTHALVYKDFTQDQKDT